MPVDNTLIGFTLFFVSVFSCLVTYFFIKKSGQFGIVDIPNHRSLHDTPKPRTGGLAVFSAMLIGLIMLQHHIDSRLLGILPYSLVIVVAAFVDDIYSISALIRLLLQVAIASAVAFNGLVFNMLTLPGFEKIGRAHV